MNKKLTAGALVVVVPATLVAGLLLSESANAATTASSSSKAAISAKVSDPTPAAGQTFTVSGHLTENGVAASGHVVKVQALTHGSWTQLTGAKMSTNSSGNYTMRLVLDTKGTRDLRVVGVGVGSQPNARDLFSVVVH
jgi:hypothetical protein